MSKREPSPATVEALAEGHSPSERGHEDRLPERTGCRLSEDVMMYDPPRIPGCTVQGWSREEP